MNDPFESKMLLVLPEIKTKKELKMAKAKAERYIKRRIYKFSRGGAEIEGWKSVYREIRRASLSNYMESFKELQNIVTVTLVVINQGLKVSCFTENEGGPGNLLMWSHYADGMRGFCIEYNKPEDVFHTKVVYRREPVRVNMLDALVENDREVANLQKKVIKHKSDIWNYEEEVRIYSRNNFVEFESGAIKKIFVGFKASRHDIDNLKKFLSEGGLSPELYLSYMSPFSYEVMHEKASFKDIAQRALERERDVKGIREAIERTS